MPTINKSEFIAGLKKSGVIEPDVLENWVNQTESDDPKTLAVDLVKDGQLTKWQAKYLLSGRTILDIGSYRLLERLKRDEMGDRFLAVHSSLGRKVDIQMLPADLTKDESRCKAFIQKASNAATLDHPNLIHVYDIDQEGGRYYLVTEHVDGGSLADHDLEGLTTTTVAKILSESLNGLVHAHDNRVPHGSLSTSDIMLLDSGDIKVGHLSESPLREGNGTTDDFARLSEIGSALLDAVAEPDEQAQQLRELTIAIGNPESDRTGLLQQLQEIVSPATLEPDVAPLTTEEPLELQSRIEPQPVRQPEPLAAGYGELPGLEDQSDSLWQRNPVAFIATAAVVTLMVVAGGGYAAMQMFGGASPDARQVAAAGNETEQSSRNAESSTNEPFNDPQKTEPTGRNRKEVPSSDELTQQINDLPTLGDEPSLEQADASAAKDQAGELLAKNDADDEGASAETSPDNVGEMQISVTTPEANSNGDEAPSEPEISEPPSDSTMLATTDSTPPSINTISTTNVPPFGTPNLGEQDRLDYINGIGDKTMRVLYAKDIKTFKQLGETPISTLKLIIKEQGWFAKPLNEYKKWISQARQRAGLPPMTETEWTASISATAATPVASATSASGNATPEAGKSMPEATDKQVAKQTPKVAPAKPLAAVPREIQLPAVDKTEPVQLSQLVIPNHLLLGLEIKHAPGFSKSKIGFRPIRGDKQTGDTSRESKQTWYVGVGRSESKLQNVAIFRKTEDSLMFEWLPEAAKNKNAEYLRNCFLRLSLPDESQTFVTLRTPIKRPDLRLTKEQLFRRLEIEIPALPKPETVGIKVLRINNFDGTEARVQQPMVSKGSPAVIWLKREDKTGFLRIQIAGDVRGKKVRLQSNLILDDGAGVQRPIESVEEFVNLSNTLKTQMDYHVGQWELVKHKSNEDPAKKAVSKAKSKAERNHELAVQYSEILNKLVNQPILYQVTAKLGEIELVLAESDTSMTYDSGKQK